MDDDNSKKMRAGKIKVDSQKCLGCMMCANIAPHVFEMDPVSGKSRVKPELVRSQAVVNKENVLSAASSCPARAISIEDNEDE